MFLFTFNLYTQINLFIKHIFTNKFITTPYYIYGGVLLGAWWCPGVLVVPGAWWLVVLPGGWWCLLASSPAYLQPDTQTGTPRGSSARRAVSRLNRSCKVRLIDAITLIVNYLDSPLGWLLQVEMQPKTLIISYLQG